jgi:putative two-component system response regulator
MVPNDRFDILVVDDDADELVATVEVLSNEGFAVAGARDGRDALRRLNGGPAPSLVLLDLTMPVMDGWQFCKALETREEAREVPIAVVTGLKIATVGELPDRRCDAGFLQKPIDPDALVTLARRYCCTAA